MRHQVVSVIPALGSLYKLAGINVKQHGLEFSGVTSRAERNENGAILVVEGFIRNTSQRPTMVPPVRVAMRGTNKQKISSWLFQPGRKVLSSGEEFRFSATMNNPPVKIHSVQLRFDGTPGMEAN